MASTVGDAFKLFFWLTFWSFFRMMDIFRRGCDEEYAGLCVIWIISGTLAAAFPPILFYYFGDMFRVSVHILDDWRWIGSLSFLSYSAVGLASKLSLDLVPKTKS